MPEDVRVPDLDKPRRLRKASAVLRTCHLDTEALGLIPSFFSCDSRWFLGLDTADQSHGTSGRPLYDRFHCWRLFPVGLRHLTSLSERRHIQIMYFSYVQVQMNAILPQICNNIVPTHVLCLPRCGLMKYHQMYGIIICQVFRKSPMQDRDTILYWPAFRPFLTWQQSRLRLCPSCSSCDISLLYFTLRCKIFITIVPMHS